MHSGGEQREVPGVSRSRVARIREELWTESSALQWGPGWLPLAGS